MLKELINRARGQVWLRVTCPYPERVLNLCSARKLAFWDLEWEGAETFTCRMSRRDHRVLSRAAEKLDCTIEIVRREGAPYTLAKLRHRQALAVGIAACGTAVLIGSFFVWDIQIAGNETVPREVILRSLEKNGVHRGCFGFALNGEDIRNHVLLEIPELLWITVNVSGCRAYVEVRERVEAPEPVDEREPTNVVARRDGLILDIQAMDGVRCVLPGTSVEAGELLISGVEDTETVGARVLTGMGKVEARTWYTLSLRLPKTEVRKAAGEGEQTRYALIFGTHRVKFYPGSSIPAAECDTIRERTELRLFGLRLPVTLERETLRPYARREVPLSADALRAKGEAILRAYLESTLAEDAEVRSALCALKEEGDTVTVTLQAECEEEIGERVPILTEP